MSGCGHVARTYCGGRDLALKDHGRYPTLKGHNSRSGAPLIGKCGTYEEHHGGLRSGPRGARSAVAWQRRTANRGRSSVGTPYRSAKGRCG